MNRQQPLLSEDEHNHLEHVPSLVRSDGQFLRWVTVRLEVDDDERVVRGVADGGLADTVPSSGTMDLHTSLV